MDYARSHGYPVPAVAEISDDETELVMERLDGPSMIDVIGRRPWTVARQARLLSDLHRRLHNLPSPEWLPAAQVGAGDRLLHLDLHPLNVLITARGPVVIDWSTAARGDPITDVAMTWVLMAAGEIPGTPIRAALIGRVRSRLVNRFLADFESEPLRRRLREVVEWKVQDENMTARERHAMWALVEANG